jgi:hypothetical protein
MVEENQDDGDAADAIEGGDVSEARMVDVGRIKRERPMRLGSLRQSFEIISVNCRHESDFLMPRVSG